MSSQEASTGLIVRQPEFGRRLRELRTRRGLSQRDLANGVVDPSYISLLESGSRVPTLDVVIQLGQALGVPITSLLGSDLSLEPSAFDAKGSDLTWQVLSRCAADFGDLAAARSRIQEAYRQACDQEPSARVLEIGLALQHAVAGEGDHEKVLTLNEELLGLASSLRLTPIVTKLRADCAAAARNLGRFGQARRFAEAALATITDDKLNGTVEHIRLLSIQVSIMCDTGDLEEVPALLERMFEIAGQHQSQAVRSRVHWVAATAYSRLGDADLAREHLSQARDGMGSAHTPLRDWAHFCRAAASVLLDAGNDLEEAHCYIEQAHAATEAMASPAHWAALRAVQARYECAAGNPQRAVDLVTALEEDFRHLSQYDLARLQATLAQALDRLGRREDAIEHLQAAASNYEQLKIFRLAAAMWRELDRLRSRPVSRPGT
jgi:transcriptional regulator with XRE-family HTH domain